MRYPFWIVGGLLVVALLALACGPATPAAQPAKPAAEPAKPAAPAAQPAKPAAEAPQPAVEPAKPAAAPGKEVRRIIHGTSQLSSSYGLYSAALVNLLNKHVPSANATLVENGSIVNNLRRMRAGEADFAMGDHTIQFMAYTGELKGWEGNPQTDLRLLWVFDVNANAYVVSERDNIKSIDDLNGKAFSPGGQGTSAEVVTLQAFELLGIKAQLYRGTMSEVVQAFKDRRVVGFVKAQAHTRPDPLILDAKTSLPVRILSWPEEALKKVQAKYPYFKTVEIAAGVYPDEWNKQPITTWGSPVSIFATTKFPEDLAYAYTKAVLADKTEQAAAFPALKDVDIGKLTVSQGIIPLHKGALKALREAGHQAPQNLVPAEAQ
jgi:TRAP transporter TAXI family solute receptor